MRPYGIIYQSSFGALHGDVTVSLSLPTFLTFRLLNILGSLLVVFSLVGLLFLFGPIVREEVTFRAVSHEQPSHLGSIVEQALAEKEHKLFVEQKAKDLNAPNTTFSIIIPKINARAMVVSNVSTTDEKSYREALKVGVAHAAGTVFPGMQGTSFLFAHSTDTPLNFARYNAVFYLLKEMETGEEFYIFFNNEFYTYRVADKQITEASDVSWIANAQNSPEQLVLQTCWPPGTTLKRLIIVGKPV